MSTFDRTILALLHEGREDAPALRAPGREALTHGTLRRQVGRTVATLNAFGIHRGDRVALALPNGPEHAAALVAVAAGATAAPLDPASRPLEIEAYLSAVGARALLVQHGAESSALDVARRLAIPVIELVPDRGGPAGAFAIRAPASSRTGSPRFAVETDTALVLQTSGTSSRPKIVPLTQRNLWESARNVRASFALGEADCGLNVMPLFHGHGLIAVVLASLGAGASVFCAPGFDPFRFFAWLEEARPTWYSATPAMHHVIVARSAGQAVTIGGARLRVIRSASATLPLRLLLELERVFGVPVIDSYSMTEAATQITANPLPPRPRKLGTVGIAAGPTVAIMDAAGTLLPPGQVGEIVIHGPSVTRGYEGDRAVNAESFRDGWLRTGDQGVQDAEGYLTLTGRLKELINRGGEKVSPVEVEQVLLDHTAVTDAVCFAIPHARLGEEVAAAVVLREGQHADEASIRRFASIRLAGFKVPRRVVVVPNIPRSPTGKVERVGLPARLARELGLVGSPPKREGPPRPQS